jgi:hypothetical protein
VNKKIFTAIFVTLSLMGIFIVFPVSAVKASPATVTKPLPWACITKEISGLDIDLWTFDEAWQIETSSGQVILIAHFDIPEEYRPNKAIKITGFVTPTWGAGSTDDTMIILTPGGRAMLTAMIHP